MGWSLCKALGLQPRIVSSVDELAPGIPRPSSVLAGMVATRLVQFPEKFRVIAGDGHVRWSDSKMSVTRTVRTNYAVDVELVTLKVEFKEREYTKFSPGDEKKLLEGFKRGLALKKEKDAALAREKAEQEALDLIQELFGEASEEKKKECA